MNQKYKEMCMKAEAFQNKYKDKSTHKFWHPRLSALIKIAEYDISPDIAKSESRVFQTMTNVYDFMNEIDPYDTDAGSFCQEHLYLFYIMNRMFGMKWSEFLNKWINVEESYITHCIYNDIDIYMISTEYIDSNVIKLKVSLDLEELLDPKIMEGNNEYKFDWYITNLKDQDHNKLYKYLPIQKTWKKL